MKVLPTRDDYEQFMDKFTLALEISHSDVCFFTYGSFDREDCDYGRSDIDGGLILPSGIVSDKEKIKELSDILSGVLLKTRIKTGFNLLDEKTCVDGRFLSYGRNYTSYLQQHARIRSGPDLVSSMNGLDWRHDELHSAAMNFSGPGGVRRLLLYLPYKARKSPQEYYENIMGALEKVGKFPKKLLMLRKRELVPNREKAVAQVKDLLELDLPEFEEINHLLSHSSELAEKINRRKIMPVLYTALNCMEKMIEAYVKKFPQPCELEVKL